MRLLLSGAGGRLVSLQQSPALRSCLIFLCAQALWTLCFLPITTAQRGIELGQLPAYMAQGLGVLFGADSGNSALVAALPCAYILWNVVFNITIVSALRVVGAVAMVRAAAAPRSSCFRVTVAIHVRRSTNRVPAERDRYGRHSAIHLGVYKKPALVGVGAAGANVLAGHGRSGGGDAAVLLTCISRQIAGPVGSGCPTCLDSSELY